MAPRGTPRTSSTASNASPSGAADALTSKGRPTPSRKQAQAAKARPLVGAKDKAARAAERDRQRQLRERARIGMMRGEERFLPVRDRGPQRRFVRDYVDARISIGEFLIPAMVVVLLMSFLPPQWQVASLTAIWAYLAFSVIDAVTLGITLKRKLAAKFGTQQLQPGFRWYAAMRALQFRMLRMPKPQVKRFNFPA